MCKQCKRSHLRLRSCKDQRRLKGSQTVHPHPSWKANRQIPVWSWLVQVAELSAVPGGTSARLALGGWKLKVYSISRLWLRKYLPSICQVLKGYKKFSHWNRLFHLCLLKDFCHCLLRALVLRHLGERREDGMSATHPCSCSALGAWCKQRQNPHLLGRKDLFSNPMKNKGKGFDNPFFKCSNFQSNYLWKSVALLFLCITPTLFFPFQKQPK